MYSDLYQNFLKKNVLLKLLIKNLALCFVGIIEAEIVRTKDGHMVVVSSLTNKKNRLRSSKPSAFTWKTSLLWYNRTIEWKYLPEM